METKAAAAEKETSEKVHAAIDTSKADAKARQDEFKSNVAKKKAAAGSDWTKLQQEHNQRVQIGDVPAKKDARVDRKRAEHRAEDAEEYAVDSIYFASIAIDDAEIATLEAIEARAHAESLT